MLFKFKYRAIMTLLWYIFLFIVIAYTILGWTLYFMQPRFLFQPRREVSYDPSDIDPGRAGQAVVAVDAFSPGVVSEGVYDG